MKKIFKFHWNCGRMGNLEGIFVKEEEAVQKSIGRYAYFGEVLGKHSLIYGHLEEGDFQVLSEDQDFVQKFIDILGGGTISGYNPLDFLEEECM